MASPPTGTITFLFTDIEGSTRRWEHHPESMRKAVIRHDALLREAIESRRGYVFKTVGDAFCAAFPTPSEGLDAALTALYALDSELWDEGCEIRVRMALHTGSAEERDGDYFGPTLNRVARLLSAGHGGQLLLSAATQALVREAAPAGLQFRDLGDHRLKDLARPENIFQVVAPGLNDSFAALNTLDTRLHNLPIQPTLFVGREREVAAILELMRRPGVRFVTLTGPGGTGKTRLALQVAADLIDDFQDGVWFIQLADVRDTTLVVSTIAEAFNIKESGDQPLMDGLTDFLNQRSLLLVLDNFEQITDAAPTVARLIDASANSRVLVTSRSVLHVYGEQQFPVPALGVPDPQRLPPLQILSGYDSVALFTRRAQAARPDFQLTDDNAPAVAEICYRLEGLPLAIELAAARIKLLPPQAMLSRLSSQLKLLTGGARDLSSRQQTLRGAIDWSYELLDAAEKQLLTRLAVFVGGSTLEAAETVCNAQGDLEIDILDGMASLVDKSLVRQIDQEGDEPRFSMLQTIREYASDQLEQNGELQEFRAAHASYYAELADQISPRLRGPEQGTLLHILAAEHNNIRAAIEWFLETDSDRALRLTTAVWFFWQIRGHLSEGRRWLNDALSRPCTDDLLRAGALQGAGMLAHYQSDDAEARELLQQCLALYRALGDARGIGNALNDIGIVQRETGQYHQAGELFTESLALFREMNDKSGIQRTLSNFGGLRYLQGDYDGARALLEESLALARQTGEKRSLAVSLHTLAVLSNGQGDSRRAVTLFEEALEAFRQLGDRYPMAMTLNSLAVIRQDLGEMEGTQALLEESLALLRELDNKPGLATTLDSLGLTARRLGELERAAALYRESLETSSSLGDHRNIAYSLEGVAMLAAAQGRPTRAARLAGSARALRESSGIPLAPRELELFENDLAVAQRASDEQAWAAECERGRTMPLHEAIAYAMNDEAPD